LNGYKEKKEIARFFCTARGNKGEQELCAVKKNSASLENQTRRKEQQKGGENYLSGVTLLVGQVKIFLGQAKNLFNFVRFQKHHTNPHISW
jgi:hypothetical protein